jgi:hypothetical protein
VTHRLNKRGCWLERDSGRDNDTFRFILALLYTLVGYDNEQWGCFGPGRNVEGTFIRTGVVFDFVAENWSTKLTRQDPPTMTNLAVVMICTFML